MPALIFRPARNAMQSGKGKSLDWVLQYEQTTPRYADPLMGWTSTNDTQPQVRLRFATKEEALAYAARKGIEVQVLPDPPVRQQRKSYSENFKFGRDENWTH